MARILIVDDDPDVTETIRLVLEKEGHKISSASNQRDGLAAVEKFKPELLILDVMMEESDDGIAMAQELRRRGFKKPILMLTSLGSVTGYTFGSQEGVVPVDDFQEKPIAPAKLAAHVAALLKKEA
jgi:DNA-binding response OmpR family regulator